MAERVASRYVSAKTAPFLLNAIRNYLTEHGPAVAAKAVSEIEDAIREAKEEGLDQGSFIKAMYPKVVGALADRGLELFDEFDFSRALENTLVDSLDRANREAVAPSIEYFSSRPLSDRVEVEFHLWWGQADEDNADAWANAPDVNDLLRRVFGSEFRAGRYDTKNDDFGGMSYVWSVQAKLEVNLVTLLGSGFQRLVERELLKV